MTKEEAWLVWVRATKTSSLPVETDFDVITRTSWWAAFEAGWDAAAVNLNGWDDAYMTGVQAGKQIRTHTPEDVKKITSKWVGLTNEEIADVWKTEYFNISYELPRAVEAKLKEKNNG